MSAVTQPVPTGRVCRPVSSLHWVFGYGSLIWKQDFPFLEARPASISGWARRFWQGSHDHRGVADAPGRVVTLVEAPGEVCHGRAFLVGEQVFEHLDHREKNGYERRDLPVIFDDEVVTATTYVAAVGNRAYLGAAPMHEMIAQIERSAGESGSNREYVIELARALEELGIDDPHVRTLAWELEAQP